MECPSCRKIDNDVIDSRLTPERNAIRRRRQCSACAIRFTTYESTADNLLLVLIKTNAVQGPSISNLKAVLKSISKALKALTQETEKLIDKVDKGKKAVAA